MTEERCENICFYSVFNCAYLIMLVGRVFNMLSLIRVLYHNHNKSQDLKIGTYIVPLYLIVTSLRLPLSLMKKTVKKMLSDISGTLIRE
jgi:hypothetical protein